MSEFGYDDLPHGNESVPDFTQEALAHLQVHSDDFALHVQAFLEAPGNRGRQQLCDGLSRFRNTLVLLEKNAAVFVAEELLILLEADNNGRLADQDELARVLLQAADQLSEHVALLRQDVSLESALPLLPLVNDSRACRGEVLLSEVLMLAAGIELPSVPSLGLGSDVDWTVSVESIEQAQRQWGEQRQLWVEQSGVTHALLAQRLLDWWKDTGNDTKSTQQLLAKVAGELERQTRFCEPYEYLQALVPLFQSSTLVALAIGRGELADGAALRSLFAQLERSVRGSKEVSVPEDLVSGDLLRNFLYYVAQIETSDKTAIELRRRFRLDRIRQVARANDSQGTATIGVGYHLSRAISSSVVGETQALRDWLNAEPEELSSGQPKLTRLRVRLVQLEAVLTLMGALDALQCLRTINKDLQALDERRPIGTLFSKAETQIRQRLAESLLLLDLLLDRNARSSVKRGATPPLPVVDQSKLVYVDMAVDACLREARTTLRQITDLLQELLPVVTFSTGRCRAVSQELHRLDQALQILPLPELTPLLRGLGDLLTRLQLYSRQHSAGGNSESHALAPVYEQLARLLASIDFYLGCVLQPQAASGKLLNDAEEALMKARALLIAGSKSEISMHTDPEVEARIVRVLPFWNSIGEALSVYRRDRSVGHWDSLGSSLQQFRNESRQCASSGIQQLAVAASGWFEREPHEYRAVSEESLELLDQVHSIIPQLIDQWLSGAASVAGFEELIARLNGADDELGLNDTGGLTLNIDDDLLPDPLDGSQHLMLDTTLQHVFHFECLGHIETLEKAVKSALQPSAEVSQRLPTEQMLRALHTLAGSAQAADAPRIVAIVMPLQRAALARQREGAPFNAAETRYIGELLYALRERLNTLAGDEPVAPDVMDIEKRLAEFVEAIIPGSDGQDGGLSIGSSIRSMQDVFSEEGRELLNRLRQIVDHSSGIHSDIDASLSILHTLKGSARMAGRLTIADHAHALESQIQQLNDKKLFAAVLKQGYATLSGLVLQADALRSVVAAQQIQVSRSAAESASVAKSSMESLLVTDTAYDGLLDLATDVTVNQARLSDQLTRIRDVYQDIETASVRWRALPPDEPLSNSTAAAEILADLEAARRVMRAAVLQAEQEQQQVSRAASGLQQSLIRTRLVRLDEVKERLTRTIEDAAEISGCRAQLTIVGGELTLDRALFGKLLAPLEHLARNAVMHGIEDERERVAIGKKETGRITLSSSIDGTDLVLEFSDDGRGIDRAELNHILESRGEKLVETHEDLQTALFRSGYTSVESPSALAGHGLGLAAVQAAVELMGGQVRLVTQLGEGTRIRMRVPQRIVVNQVVLVESGGALFAVPVSQVESVRMAGGVSDKSEYYRRVPLAQLVSQRSSIVTEVQNSTFKPCILVSTSSDVLAVEVDQVIGYRELVTQTLGPQMASLKRYSGGCVLSDGRQVLILDLSNAVDILDKEHFQRNRPAHESLSPVALLVDDSLTVRIAAEKILQQCGISVRQCRDGVEALESINTATPNLIILDIEMPRLDGIALLRRIKSQYGEACPPVVVISSRDSEKLRTAMHRLGVVRFLPKPFTAAQMQAAVEAAGLRLPDLTIA